MQHPKLMLKYYFPVQLQVMKGLFKLGVGIDQLTFASS